MSENPAARLTVPASVSAHERRVGLWKPEDTIRELTSGLGPFVRAKYPPNMSAREIVAALNAAKVVPLLVHAAFALNAPGRRPGWDGYSDVIASGLGLRADMGGDGMLTGHGNSHVRGHQYDYDLSVPFRRTEDCRGLDIPEGRYGLMPNACVVNMQTGRISVFGHQRRGIGTLAPGRSGSDSMAVMIAMQRLAGDMVQHLHAEGGDAMQERFDRNQESAYVPVAYFGINTGRPSLL